MCLAMQNSNGSQPVDKMVTDETFSRVRSLHECCGAHYGCAEGGNIAARSRVQETGGSEPAQARAETEGQVFRLPRCKRPTLVDRRYFSNLPGEFGISPRRSP